MGEVFEKLNTNGTGQVGWPEFEAMTRSLYGVKWDRQEQEATFRCLDASQTGSFGRQDWVAYYMNKLAKLTDQQFNKFVQRLSEASERKGLHPASETGPRHDTTQRAVALG